MNINNSNYIQANLQQKIDAVRTSFKYPKNKDLIVRQLYIKSLNRSGALIFIESMVNSQVIEREIITPLMRIAIENPNNDFLNIIEKQVLTVKSVKKITNSKDLIEDIINGNTVLLIDGITDVLSLSTIGYEHRSVEKPTNENTLKGPREAFVESSQVNRSLIRRSIKSEDLVTESMQIGSKQLCTVYILYLDDIVDKELVEKVKKRLSDIKAEYIENLSILEQHIEDRPYSLVSTVLYTERPDRVVGYLNEGHAALIMDNSPSCLIVPVTFWSFFHTGEEQYERWFYGNFIRIIRLVAFIIAFAAPALYIAVTNFHQEMIPTDLVLAIAGSRETLPFPAILEVLLMELSFELIRESSTRIPSTIGPTIGIVGALILGQAAVQANIVSPILVIIVAITGLSSFAVPEISFSYTIRIARFILILAAITLGFFGVSICVSIIIAYLVSIKSFDVPFISPMAPHYRSSKDLIVRPVTWKEWIRPLNLHPKDKAKQKKPGE